MFKRTLVLAILLSNIGLAVQDQSNAETKPTFLSTAIQNSMGVARSATALTTGIGVAVYGPLGLIPIIGLGSLEILHSVSSNKSLPLTFTEVGATYIGHALLAYSTFEFYKICLRLKERYEALERTARFYQDLAVHFREGSIRARKQSIN